jgi:hypothetical protein
MGGPHKYYREALLEERLAAPPWRRDGRGL